MRGGTNNVDARMPPPIVGAGTRRLRGVSKVEVKTFIFAGGPSVEKFVPILVVLGAVVVLVVGVVAARSRRRGRTHTENGDEVLDPWSREKGQNLVERWQHADNEAPDGPPFEKGTNTKTPNYMPQPDTFPPATFNAPPKLEAQIVDLDPTNAETAALEGVPVRRTSYSQTIDSLPAEDEVVVAPSWKRHTRVYGGGVCEACEESAAKMRAMGFVVV